jgi:hypothetical protein
LRFLPLLFRCLLLFYLSLITSFHIYNFVRTNYAVLQFYLLKPTSSFWHLDRVPLGNKSGKAQDRRRFYIGIFTAKTVTEITSNKKVMWYWTCVVYALLYICILVWLGAAKESSWGKEEDKRRAPE